LTNDVNAYAVLNIDSCDIFEPHIIVSMEGSMRAVHKQLQIVGLIMAIGLPIVLAAPAYAQSGDISNVENFIRSIIKVVAGLAGLVATGFFVAGGFTYITSSGNPEQLDKAKRTLTWSAIGLAIVIAAFVISNIVTTLATQAFGS
jgi:hypothetical protein